MQRLLIAALLAPSIALAGGKPPSSTPPPRMPHIIQDSYYSQARSDARNAATSQSTSESTSSGGAAAASGGSASGGSAGISVTDKGSARAPDISSYPTAPCTITGGISGGWIGGAFGISGSAVDEGCDIREFSRILHEQGNKAAGTQILCLNGNARKALEVTGTKCLITADAPPPVVKP